MVGRHFLKHVRYSFGRLQNSGTATISGDHVNWYDVDCFLFDKVIICVMNEEHSRHKVAASGLASEATKGPDDSSEFS
jgi:hypothetical protein